MSPLRFDGRVAVVTGAGRGIGRAYALLLARLGGSVVVNDVGGSVGGEGADNQPASAVADEIVAGGGRALADGSDVSTEEGASRVIAAAVENFGGIDVLINNAGIMRWAGFPDVTPEDMQAHLAVHAMGSFHASRAAWTHMASRGYGRIVMTTSTGVLGLADNTAYAVAKGSVIGLTRSLAVAGAPSGIKVNAIAPAAFTRMAGPGAETDTASPLAGQMPPEMVAPMAAFLAHEDCPVSGEIYTAGARRFARLFVGSTEGYVHSSAPSIDDVAAHWTEINDTSGFSVPADLRGWSSAFFRQLRADG